MGRTEKSIKNIAFGFGAQLVTTIITFVTRSLFVKMLGDDVNSLNGLFHEIIMNLSLAELGIGSAIVYNLYKPLAENDTEKVSELMTFFKNIYRLIAGVLLVLGSVVCIFVPLLVKDLSFTNSYMRIIFMLFVVNISSSYLFSYKIALLNADQKNYIYSFYSSILGVVQAVIFVVVLLVSKNYIVYLVASICTTVFNNFVISRQVDKRYKYLTKRALPKEDRKNIFANVKNIFIKELSGKITSSTDNILISVLVSTTMVGRYTFYSAILTIFKQITERVEAGVRSSMGNLFVSADNENCKKVIDRLTWGYGVFGVFCSVCLYSCAEQFISFWVGPQYLLDKYILFILVVNLFCYIISKPIYAAMHVAGYFVEGRNISIIGSVVNLAVSIVLGYFTGIFGIFLGTFCTYFIQIIMKIHYVYKLKFNETGLKYGWMLIRFSALLVLLTLGCGYICSFVNTSVFILAFFISGIIAAVISVVFILLIWSRSEFFKYYFDLVKKMIIKKRR